MANRRFDALYFLAFLCVVAGAFWLTRADDEASDGLVVPDFALPSIELEAPFEMPYVFVRFARPPAPQLQLGQDTEKVIAEVRASLLETSDVIDASADRTLAAAYPADR